jgi:hypothetical protein
MTSIGLGEKAFIAESAEDAERKTGETGKILLIGFLCAPCALCGEKVFFP